MLEWSYERRQPIFCAPNRPMNKLIGPIILSIVAAVVVYGIALFFTGSAEGIEGMLAVSSGVWLTTLSLSLVNYAIRFFRWDYYIRHATGKSLALGNHCLIYVGGFALTTTPGKVGEALRSFYLGPLGIGMKQSLAVLFTERLIDILTIFLLSLLTFSLFQVENLWLLMAIAGVLVMLSIPLLRSDKFWLLVLSMLNRGPARLRQLGSVVVEMSQLAATLVKGRVLYLGLGAGLIAWAAEGVGLFIVLSFFDADISIQLAIGIYAIAVLAGAATFLPGGLGGTEAVMILLLVAAGVDNSVAVVATLVCRIVTLWFAVFLGVGALSILATQGKLPEVTELGESKS